MRTIYAQLGDAYRVYAPGRQSHTWVFNHPDDVRRILISNHKNYAKGVGFDRIKILLGNGIIVSEGEFWKRQRRMLQPTFHRRVLAQFDTLIARANDRLLAEWDRKCEAGEPVDVTADMSTMTLEIILGAIFGDDLAAMHAGMRSDVEDVIGGADRVFIVFHHDHCITQVAQAYQRTQQALVVALVQADAGFVQHVHHPDQAGADLRRQAYALGFTAGQRVGLAFQGQVIQAYVYQEAEPFADFLDDLGGDLATPAGQGQAAEKGQGFVDRQDHQFG